MMSRVWKIAQVGSKIQETHSGGQEYLIIQKLSDHYYAAKFKITWKGYTNDSIHTSDYSFSDEELDKGDIKIIPNTITDVSQFQWMIDNV